MAPIPLTLSQALKRLREDDPFFLARDDLVSNFRFDRAPVTGEVLVHKDDPITDSPQAARVSIIAEVSVKSFIGPGGGYKAGDFKQYDEDVTNAKSKLFLQLPKNEGIQAALSDDWLKALANIEAIQKLSIANSGVKPTKCISPVKTVQKPHTVLLQHSLVIVRFIFYSKVYLSNHMQLAASN